MQEDGSVKQFSGKTKSAVQSKVNDWKNKGMLDNHKTISNIAAEWTKEYQLTGDGGQRTLDGYISVMDKYITKEIGNIPVLDFGKASVPNQDF